MIVVSDDALHFGQRALRPIEIDAAGALDVTQHLGDAAGQFLFLPALAVGDQLPDGAEIAGCREPGSTVWIDASTGAGARPPTSRSRRRWLMALRARAGRPRPGSRRH